MYAMEGEGGAVFMPSFAPSTEETGCAGRIESNPVVSCVVVVVLGAILYTHTEGGGLGFAKSSFANGNKIVGMESGLP